MDDSAAWAASAGDAGAEVVVAGGILLRRNGDGSWSEPRYPAVCANGHELGPYRVTIGVSHCRCGILHRTAQCNECAATYYLPRPTDRCEPTALDGRHG